MKQPQSSNRQQSSNGQQPSNHAIILGAIITSIGVIVAAIIGLYKFNASPFTTPIPAISSASGVLTQAPTLTPQQKLYQQATSGVPIINGYNQSSLQWDSYTHQPSGSCIFKKGTYYSIATSGNSSSCNATESDLANLALQADVTIIQGDNAGIIFRSNTKEDSFYAFCITTNGSYYLQKSFPSTTDVQDYSNLNIENSPTIQQGIIKQGIKQTNLLTVITRGNTFYLYVNEYYVGSVSDSSYTSGEVGIFTNSENEGQIEAAFTNFKVWKV
jgi:hypothetical protein